MKTSIEHGLASLRIRSVWTRGILIAGIVISAIGFMAGLVTLIAVLGNAAARDLVTPAAVKGLAAINSLLAFGVFVASIVMILLWIHRAHANLRAIGLSELNYSPGWAVGSFFVPVVNLFVPFRAMRELFNRSHGEPAHFAAITVPDVNSWWPCYLVSNFLAMFVTVTAALGPVTGIHVVTPPGVNVGLALFSNGLGIGASLLLYRIVGSVTRAQQSSTGISETFA